MRTLSAWLLAGLVTIGALGAVDWDPVVTVSADDPAWVSDAGVLTLAGLPFTGMRERHTDAGMLIEQVSYRDGVRHGPAEAWYESGARRYERHYRNGAEEGTHRGWYENGQATFVLHFQDGVLEGEALEWFADGTPYKEFHFVDGHEEGQQRMWYEDGELRANYVMKDGRRYGRMGAKGCITPTDEELES